MPSSTTRTVGSAVNTIDASALESLEAINHRLKDGGLTDYMKSAVALVKYVRASRPGQDSGGQGCRQDHHRTPQTRQAPSWGRNPRLAVSMQSDRPQMTQMAQMRRRERALPLSMPAAGQLTVG